MLTHSPPPSARLSLWAKAVVATEEPNLAFALADERTGTFDLTAFVGMRVGLLSTAALVALSGLASDLEPVKSPSWLFGLPVN